MFWVFIRELKQRILKERLYDLAAQLAYYFLMSLFPFLLFTVTVLAYLPVSSDNILRLIQPFAPEDTYVLVENNLRVILDQQRGGIFSVSLIVTLYLASIAFQSVIRILNNAYQVEQTRPFSHPVAFGNCFNDGAFDRHHGFFDIAGVWKDHRRVCVRSARVE